MKFKLVESFDDHVYQDYFIIKRNEAGNYCAYHKDNYKNHRRELVTGEEEIDPYCWSGRKKLLEDILDEITLHYPDELKNSMLSRDVASYYGIRTYDGNEFVTGND